MPKKSVIALSWLRIGPDVFWSHSDDSLSLMTKKNLSIEIIFTSFLHLVVL